MPRVEPQGDADAIRTLPLTLPTGSAVTDGQQNVASTQQQDRAPVRPKYAGAATVYGAVDRRKATEFLRDKNDRYSPSLLFKRSRKLSHYRHEALKRNNHESLINAGEARLRQRKLKGCLLMRRTQQLRSEALSLTRKAQQQQHWEQLAR
jgi:hypothetical protein